jgi:long-chain acyl-CoA synthetase
MIEDNTTDQPTAESTSASAPLAASHRIPAGTIPADLNTDNFTNLLDLLDFSMRHGDAPAYTSMGRTLSFTELGQMSDAFAAHLVNNTNLQRGDRIAIQLPNILQYPIALYGAWKAGLIVVNTNPLYTADEMKHQFNDAGVKAIVIYQSMACKLQKILPETEIEHVFLSELADFHSPLKRRILQFVIKNIKKLEPAFSLPTAASFRQVVQSNTGKSFERASFTAEEIAVLQYTGGTTGVAKGAMLTHANLISNILQGLEGTATINKPWYETAIAPLPLYHIYAFTLTQAIMYRGGHSVLIPNPRDIPGFVKELKKWPFTCFMGLNTLFIALCRDPGFSSVNFDKLMFTVSGGMALTQTGAQLWKDTTGCEVGEGYGLTETSPIVAINDPVNIQLGTVGLAVPHTTFKLIDEDGNTVPEGEPGEITVSGPQVMLGYWKREDSTARVFTEDGYLKTGDIGVWQADGCLRIVDRAKDMIIVSGFKVFPNQLEDVITQHPQIIECAIVGVPDETTGEAVKLFAVKTEEPLEHDALISWCREKLTAYKIPKQIEFRDELPKSNVGKILRRMLRDEEETAE